MTRRQWPLHLEGEGRARSRWEHGVLKGRKEKGGSINAQAPRGKWRHKRSCREKLPSMETKREEKRKRDRVGESALLSEGKERG